MAALAAVEAKDLPGLLSLHAHDGVFIDPHFPEPAMRGRSAIERGHVWAFAGMRSFGLTEADDGRITRLQAYEPYGPPGVAGVVLRLARLTPRWRR